MSFMYADDTSILNIGENLVNLENVTHTNTNKITQYFETNNLFTNLSKTNFILFQKKQRKDASELSVTIKNKEIKEENSTNFLGVIIDSNLTWELQIDKICSKISSNLFTIKRLSTISELDVLITIYYGLVYPYLKYGITVWGSCPKRHTKRVFILQKRAIRYIIGLKQTDSCRESFIRLKILTLYSLYIYMKLFYL
jgi:hypothetical protein